MEKRLILTVALCSLVLLIWSMIMPKPQQTSQFNSQGPVASSVSLPPAQEAPKGLLTESKDSSAEALFSYSTDKFEVVFDENQASIKEIIFKDYQRYKYSLGRGFAFPNKLKFKKDSVTLDSVTFVAIDKDKEIKKRFLFSNSNYSIGLEINVQNVSNTSSNINLPVILGTIDIGSDQNLARFLDVTVSVPDKILRPNIHKDQVYNQLKFLGLRDRYFCAIIAPTAENYSGVVKKIDSKRTEIYLETKDFLVAPGGKVEQKYEIYLGPQNLKLINAIKLEWAGIVHYGTFDIISQVLLQLLDIFHQVLHNWGLAIILLSLAIYFLLYPLSIKQMRSMKEMQAIQPRVEELRKNYKDNPQKLNKEIMELYREHKVNPLGGCLPMILQLPIFFALYQSLMRSIALKGARFLWIQDLSEPDKLLTLPVSLPILGNEINLLPLLMMIGMFVQQKITMKVSGTAGNEQQKMMLIIFPLMFGFIFYHMPAGLVLYWFVNSILMLIYQVKTSKT